MLMRLFALTALVLCVMLSAGCFKMKQIVTVMPDGSGKIEFTMGISEVTARQAGGENPIDEFTIENMSGDDMPRGIVAMTEPERWEEDGFEYVRFTMYFDDINEFATPEGDNEEMFATYDFVDEEGGCSLTVNGGMINSILTNIGQVGPDELAMLRAEMAEFEGFEIVELYILPGEASAIEGVTMEDNTADVTIDLDNIMNDDGTIDALQEAAPFAFEVDENTIDQETIDAFAAELAQAIEDWETLKEEMGME